MDTIRAAMCNIRGEVVHQESEARSDLWRAKCRGAQEFELAPLYDNLVAATATACALRKSLCDDVQLASPICCFVSLDDAKNMDIHDSMKQYFCRDKKTGRLCHTEAFREAVTDAWLSEDRRRITKGETSQQSDTSRDTPCESTDHMTELLDDDETDEPDISPDPWWWANVSDIADDVIRKAFNQHRSEHPDVLVDPDNDPSHLDPIKQQLKKVSLPELSEMTNQSDKDALCRFADLIITHSPVLYQGDGMGVLKGWALPPSFMQVVGDRVYAEKARNIPIAAQKGITDEINRLVKEEIIEPSSSPWSHAMMAVRKKDGKFRVVLDCRALNGMCVMIRWPLRSIQELLAQCAGKDWITVSDLTSGYWQISLPTALRPLTAFSVWNLGRFQYRRMPQGYLNSGSGLAYCVQAVLGDMTKSCCQHAPPFPEEYGVTESDIHGHRCLVTMYADDLTIASSGRLELHRRDVQCVLARARTFAMGLSAKKTIMAAKRVTILGYDCTSSGIMMSRDKVDTLLNSEEPTTRSRLHSYNGLCSFYRKFCQQLAEHARCFTDFLKKGAPERIDPLLWEESGARHAFKAIRHMMAKFTVLAAPDLGPSALPGGIIPDASQWALGACCFQEQLIDTVISDLGESQNIVREVPIGYFSRVLTDAETRWSATERELKALVDGHAHFKWVSLLTNMRVVTDHQALVYLFKPSTFNKDCSSTRLYSLAMAIQHIHAIVEHRRGSLIEMSPGDWASRSTECTVPPRPRTDKQRTPADDTRESRLGLEQDGDHIPRVLLLRESPYLQGTPLPAWGDDDKPNESLMKAAKQYLAKYQDIDSCVPISDGMRRACKDQAYDTKDCCSIVRDGFIRQPKC